MHFLINHGILSALYTPGSDKKPIEMQRRCYNVGNILFYTPPWGKHLGLRKMAMLSGSRQNQEIKACLQKRYTMSLSISDELDSCVVSA